MQYPGIKALGDVEITAALTGKVVTANTLNGGAIDYVANLQGMQALTLQAELVYGSGGTSIAAVIQTSLDQGLNWIDICRFDFTTASARKVANLSGMGSKAVAAVSALGAEGVNDFVLGDRLRAVVTSVGTYAGTTLRLRGAAR